MHSDNAEGEKNKDAMIPDIVAVKNGTALFFENKDRFYFPDYMKVNGLIADNQYTKSINKLLYGYAIENIYYGIGLPTEKHKEKSKESVELIDFLIGVNANKTVMILHNPKEISF